MLPTYYMNTHLFVSTIESTYFLLCLIQTAAADVFLEVTNFSHSEVELACGLNYEANMTGIYFDAYKGRYACLHKTIDWCKRNTLNNCTADCLISDDPRVFRFVVDLDGRCEETLVVRCRISTLDMENTLNKDKSIKLTAQSDPPVISVNNSQPVEASLEPVQITCTVTNMCDATKLDILGDIYMKPTAMNHTKVGGRFTTTATSEAIFSEAGNYSFICKEMGKEDIFARNYTLVVAPSEKVMCSGDDENGDDRRLFTILLATTWIVSFILGILIEHCLRMRRWTRTRFDAIEDQQETVTLG